jgi:hypothetical protein
MVSDIVSIAIEKGVAFEALIEWKREAAFQADGRDGTALADLRSGAAVNATKRKIGSLGEGGKLAADGTDTVEFVKRVGEKGDSESFCHCEV